MIKLAVTANMYLRFFYLLIDQKFVRVRNDSGFVGSRKGQLKENDMKPKCSCLSNEHIRVACPKFGHPALISEWLNYALHAEFVAAVGMLRKY